MQEVIQKGFKLTMADSKLFKEGIEAISGLITEANLTIKPEGLEIISMDPANVAMVVFRINNSFFTTYNVAEEQKIGLNISNFKQVLRRLKSGSSLSIELQEGKLKVSTEGNISKAFNLPLIEMDEKEQKVPDLKFPLKVMIPSTLLADAIEDVDIVAESASFLAEANKFSVIAKGDTSHANIEFPKGENIKIEIEGDSNILSKYSIEYLRKIIAGTTVSENVILQFNKDYPLKLEFKGENIGLAFILAPRVEND